MSVAKKSGHYETQFTEYTDNLNVKRDLTIIPRSRLHGVSSLSRDESCK